MEAVGGGGGVEDTMSIEAVSVEAVSVGTVAAMAEQCLLVIHKLCEGVVEVARMGDIMELCLLDKDKLGEGGELMEISENKSFFRIEVTLLERTAALAGVWQWWNILSWL